MGLSLADTQSERKLNDGAHSAKPEEGPVLV